MRFWLRAAIGPVIAALITLGLAWGAWSVHQSHNRTAQQLQQESERRNNEPYTPSCGGRDMSPGDICQSGRRGRVSSSETYEDKVAAHQESNSPESIRSADKIWRIGALIVGGLVLLIGGLTTFGLVQAAREKRLPPERRGQGPARAAFAEAQGWRYAAVEPGLAGKLSVGAPAGADPDAHHVITGVHNGYPFILFDHTAPGRAYTSLVLVLDTELPPIDMYLTVLAKLQPPNLDPSLWPRLTGGVAELVETAKRRSSEQGQALLTPQVRSLVDAAKLDNVVVSGNAMIDRQAKFSGFYPQQVLRRLEQLAALGAALTAARIR